MHLTDRDAFATRLEKWRLEVRDDGRRWYQGSSRCSGAGVWQLFVRFEDCSVLNVKTPLVFYGVGDLRGTYFERINQPTNQKIARWPT